MAVQVREYSATQIKRVLDRFAKVRAGREGKARAFFDGTRPYMIFQSPPTSIETDAASPTDSFARNFEALEVSLDVPSDHLQLMEPWFGTGVYANIFGCEYVWRDGVAPCVHYRYHTLDEIRDVAKPRWEDSPIAQLVMETIRLFKSKTGDAAPIIGTDPQSASDTATLVLDAAELFYGCLAEPATVRHFMRLINEVFIEFNRVQMDLIGDALAHPGHCALSNAGFTGLGISDDNLAVGSPAVNAAFNLVLDEEVGKAFGGVAIHSCGVWTETMKLVKKHCPSCVSIDCAVDRACDPNPCTPEAVRDAMAGTGIVTNVRMSGETPRMLELVERVLHPDLRLVVHPMFVDLPTAEKNYDLLDTMLAKFYSKKKPPKPAKSAKL